MAHASYHRDDITHCKASGAMVAAPVGIKKFIEEKETKYEE